MNNKLKEAIGSLILCLLCITIAVGIAFHNTIIMFIVGIGILMIAVYCMSDALNCFAYILTTKKKKTKTDEVRVKVEYTHNIDTTNTVFTQVFTASSMDICIKKAKAFAECSDSQLISITPLTTEE